MFGVTGMTKSAMASRFSGLPFSQTMPSFTCTLSPGRPITRLI